MNLLITVSAFLMIFGIISYTKMQGFIHEKRIHVHYQEKMSAPRLAKNLAEQNRYYKKKKSRKQDNTSPTLSFDHVLKSGKNHPYYKISQTLLHNLYDDTAWVEELKLELGQDPLDLLLELLIKNKPEEPITKVNHLLDIDMESDAMRTVLCRVLSKPPSSDERQQGKTFAQLINMRGKEKISIYRTPTSLLMAIFDNDEKMVAQTENIRADIAAEYKGKDRKKEDVRKEMSQEFEERMERNFTTALNPYRSFIDYSAK